MAPSIGTHCYNATLIKVDGRASLWEFDSGSGFGVFLYENNNWEEDDDWLLWKFKRNKKEALDIFNKIRSL